MRPCVYARVSRGKKQCEVCINVGVRVSVMSRLLDAGVSGRRTGEAGSGRRFVRFTKERVRSKERLFGNQMTTDEPQSHESRLVSPVKQVVTV